MMSFSGETDFARSILARIALYSVLLLDARKSNPYGMLYLFPGWGFKSQANSSSRLVRSAIHIKDPLAGVILVYIWLG